MYSKKNYPSYNLDEKNFTCFNIKKYRRGRGFIFWAQWRVNSIEYVKIRKLSLGPNGLQNNREEH